MKCEKILCLLITFAMLIANVPIMYAAGITELDLTQDAVTITSTGATGGGLTNPESELNASGYVIDGKSTATSNSIIVESGISTTITIKNVMINALTSVTIGAGSTVTLVLSGINTVTSTAVNGAGILVSNNASLTIDGDGSLLATGGAYGAGIGANSTVTSGKIIINNGTVTATGGMYAAGIGGSNKSSTGTISIYGGQVTATGNRGSAGIGGGQYSTFNHIGIYGGSVTAQSNFGNVWGIGDGNSSDTRSYPVVIDGGSINSTVQATPVNSQDKPVYKVTLTASTLANKTVEGITSDFDTWSATADSSGTITVYLPTDITKIAIKSDSSIYTANVSPSQDTSVALVLYTGSPCVCNSSSASLSFNGQDVYINKNNNSVDIALSSGFEINPACTYPLHGSKPTYEFTTSVNESIAKINGKTMTVYKAADAQTLSVRATMTHNSATYTKTAAFNVSVSTEDMFDICAGNIVISDTQVTVGTQNYPVDANAQIHIMQSDINVPTSNTVKVTSTSPKTVVLDGLKIQSTSTPVTISSITTLKTMAQTTLTATTQYTPAIKCPSGSTLILESDNILRTTGGYAAAAIGGANVGGVGKIIINSGIVYATGGYTAAAIGNGSNGSSSDITVNGGQVYATGSGGGSAIGMGLTASSATVTVNNGYVSALSDNNTGISGTLRINGGSVSANGIAQAQKKTDNSDVYFTTLTVDSIGAKPVKYTIDNGAEQTAYTDSASNLYLFIPSGVHTICITYNGVSYYKRMNISTTETNMGECTSTPTKTITEFTLPGQLSSNIDQSAHTITVTMPANAYLSSLTPAVVSTGFSYSPTAPQDFSNSEVVPVEYTVVGDDNLTQTYGVTVKKESGGDVSAPTQLNISQGNILITQTSLSVGNALFDVNPYGYVITGTSSSNIISVEDGADAKITLKDLSISFPSDVSPVNIYGKANVIIEGTVTLNGSSDYAGLCVENTGVLTLDGTGDLKVVGGINSAAIGASYLNSDVFGKVTILNGNITATGGQSAPAVGGHKSSSSIPANSFIISGGNVRLVNGSGTSQSAIAQPYNAEGTPLYPVCITVGDGSVIGQAVGLSHTNQMIPVQMKTDANGNINLYLANGKYDFTVINGETKLYASATVAGAAVNVTAVSPVVRTLSFSDPLTSSASSVTFTVNGSNMGGEIILTATPNTAAQPISATCVRNSNGTYSATVSFPANTSTTDDVTYTMSVTVDGVRQSLTGNTTITKNKFLKLSAFKVDTQIGDAIIGESTITSYLPYDQTNMEYLPVIAHNGAVIQPSGRRDFTSSVVYRVYASDPLSSLGSKDMRTYTATLFRQNEPKAQSVAFTEPTDYTGGTVDVTISGQYLENAQYAVTQSKDITVTANGLAPATAVYKDGAWVASVSVPENADRTAIKTYNLSVVIGNKTQTLSGDAQLSVPRKPQNINTITGFTIENQVGNTQITDTAIQVTVPYNKDVTNLTPTIVLGDTNASYSPTTAQNFTNPAIYTVTAEDGTTKQYTVTVTKQASPVVSGISFANPATNAGGRVVITLTGNNLESASVITVLGTNGVTPGNAILGENGIWTATIVAPTNNDTTQDTTHTLSVTVDSTAQTIDGSNMTLTVPRRLNNAKEISDFVVVDDQLSCVITEQSNTAGTVVVTVPYNTDITAITPQVYHTGVSYLPTTPQDLTNGAVYSVTAEDSTTLNYTVTVVRDGIASVDLVEFEEPKTFADSKISIKISGNIIPTDKIIVKGVLDSDVYTGTTTVAYGSATATLDLPAGVDTEKVYTLKVLLNDSECIIDPTKSTITLPRRTPRTITSFTIPNQTGNTVIGEDTISLEIPYQHDITNIMPTIAVDGDSYTPTQPQDFTKPVTYTISAADDTDRTYTVTVVRTGSPSIQTLSFINPDDYTGGTVVVRVAGEFYNNMTATMSLDTNPSVVVTGTAQIQSDGNAVITFNVPENSDTTSDASYTISITVDGFTPTLPENNKITVPKKPKSDKSITNVSVSGQVGTTDIDAAQISVITVDDITAIEPVITHTGVSISPTGVQDFTAPVVYTVTAEDGSTQTYTLSITAYRTNSGHGTPLTPENLKPTPTPTDNPTEPTPDPTDEPTKPTTKPVAVGVPKVSGYDDGTFRPSDNLTRAETASLLYSALDGEVESGNSKFTDVNSNAWYIKSVNAMSTLGVINGYEDNTFRPNSPITRAEFVVVTSKLLDIKPTDSAPTFTDINGHWASKYIMSFVERGYIAGYEDGSFAPDAPITRAESVTLLARLFDVKIEKDKLDKLPSTFKDITKTHWAYYYVEAMTK